MCPFCYIKQLFMKKKPTSVNPTFEDYPVGAATTPPMGWSSWNTFANRINEKLILDTAKAMKEKGLLDAGYRYVNLDDCWQSSLRTEDGELVADYETFPHGMEYLVKEVNKLGFQMVETKLSFFELRTVAINRLQCRVNWNRKLFVSRHF